MRAALPMAFIKRVWASQVLAMPLSAMQRGYRRVLLLVLAINLVATLYGQKTGELALQIRAGGSYLGLRLNDIDSDRAKELKLDDLSGIEITGVEDGAAADQAGIRPGDVILSYNGERVLSAQQFIRLVSETPQGRRVRVVCWRGGAQKELTVTTGAPRTFVFPDDPELARLQVSDVPSPMMLWRNVALGIESVAINEQLAQAFGVKQGVLIWSVVPAYPAQRSGLRAGDLVTGFCGRPVHSPRELGSFMQSQASQKPILVNLIRDHKVTSISISLQGER